MKAVSPAKSLPLNCIEERQNLRYEQKSDKLAPIILAK
jgi:hypothetical protein